MNARFLGQYRIDAPLGAGAMGVVHLAYDTRLDRAVAIKQLINVPPDLSKTRLLGEARAAAKLNHPNICTIHEVGEVDGHTFIVMEYIDGQPLSRVIPRHGLALETVLEHGIQIADAVAYAHAAGIVHRDLKSSNIAITRDGRPKVLDFGLALQMPSEAGSGSDSTATSEPGLAGTPQYMSPEALRGDSSNPSSDVWSLGIVLYEMATGRRPYDKRNRFELAADILSDAPVDVPPTVAPQLAAVIKRCLAKRAAQRYRQAGEVRAALEAVVPSASTMSAAPRFGGERWWRSKAAAWSAAALVLLMLIGIAPLRSAISQLVSEPAIAFAERDWLLVSDFANHAGDPVFDRSLNTALSAALTQSRYVNIVPGSRIRESLRRMGKQAVLQTDEATAREIALREGFRMVLVPAIASTGGAYLLSASLLDPTTGTTLKAETVYARSRDAVLEAVDELSGKIRGALGEAGEMITAEARPLVKATTGSLEALQHFSLGREAHISQQLDKARTLYEEALRIDPAFTSARASLGIINVEFFDRAKGIELLTQALKAVDGLGDNERVSVLGFHAMVVERNLDKAADHYKAFLTLHPDVASAHNNLGRIYMQQRKFKDAIHELQETIRLDPDLFLSYFSLNSIYLYEVGDLDAAIATAQKQLARNPNSARAYAQLGAASAGKGDWRQAENALRRSIEIDPHPRFVFDHYNLGHVLRLQGRFDEARKVHGHILEIAPKEISAHYELGAVSQLMGDEAGARGHLRKVIELSEAYLANNANDAGRALEMASAWARLGNAAKAEAIARQAEPRTVDMPVERAGLQVLLGKADDALRTLEEAVQNGYRNVVWMRTHSDLHGLAGDSRFEDLVARIQRQ